MSKEIMYEEIAKMLLEFSQDTRVLLLNTKQLLIALGFAFYKMAGKEIKQ